MLRFFRTIRKSQIETNQMKKSASPLGRYSLYAIGEILLVVLGILIALQINNWNENRKTQAKEKIILQSLLDEFKTNKSSLEGVTERINRRKESCLSLLQIISKPGMHFTKNTSDSLMLGLRTFISFDVSDGYVNGLLSTGEIRILQNDSLKHLITNWDKEVLDNAIEIELLIKQELNQIITPFLMTHYSSVNEGIEIDLSYRSPFTFDYKSIFKKPQFENIVIEKIRRFYECESGYRYLSRVIQDIISIIERELQNKTSSQ